MRKLHIDIETYSEVDLKVTGVHKYASHRSTEIMLIAYAFDSEPVSIIDLSGYNKENRNAVIEYLMCQADTVYTAYNALFEFTLLDGTDISRWRCAQARARLYGLPASLDKCGEALGIPEDKAKMKEGKRLIALFCKPCKPTKVNGGRTRNTKDTHPAEWEVFKQYCCNDVEAERAIEDRLNALGYNMNAKEQRLWEMDCIMNRKGLCLDVTLATAARSFYQIYKEDLSDRIKEITGVSNPNSVQQLKAWMAHRGVEAESLDKEAVQNLLADESIPDDVKTVLRARKSMSKTSIAKYDRALSMSTTDPHTGALIVGDGLLYCGAVRTGRWCGRGLQMHNLPKNLMEPKEMDEARLKLKTSSYATFTEHYDNSETVLSELVRTMLVPSRGKIFAIADFSAIEARVLPWLANEEWRLEVARTHGMLYEASASKMFGVPLESIAKGKENYHLRAKGKVAELALGYNGGEGALIRMGALKMGLTENELPAIKTAWREASPNIVAMWYEVERLAKLTVITGEQTHFRNLIYFTKYNNSLIVTLPSRRHLVYWDVKIGEGKFGGTQIISKTVTEKGAQWLDNSTYGGKLVENITQAVARDCLAEALLRIDSRFDIRFHVHDEIVAEVDSPDSLQEMIELMCLPPVWAPDLPLGADGFCCDYYRKD